ncbi:MAG: protein translocase subunit SecD [Candidatus Zixiibacteriota bacterium]|nr:MAG: protein translocase subunit SecD [candidate division Zixibacteria bacterium]
MRRSRLYLILLITFLICASLYALFPSMKLWSMSDAHKEEIRSTEPQELITLESKAIKLGLDLKGGMHVVLQVDQSRLNENERRDASERALEIIRNRVDQFGITEPLIHKQGGDRIVVELPGLHDVERAQALIGQTAQLEFKLLESSENTVSLLKKIDEALAQADTTLIEEEEIETAEDTLAGEEKGKESDVVKDLFGEAEEEPDTTEDTTSFLEEEEEPYFEERPFTQYLESYEGRSGFLVLQEDKPMVELLLDRPEVQELIPKDDQFAFSTRAETFQNQKYWGLYLLKKRSELSGKYLVDARPTYDQFRKPEVQFTLTKKGGRIFARVTGANIDKPLAITLDGRVESAPIIRSKIRDRGVIEMGGVASIEDATDLSIVLRAGALPAPVKVIENRVIGPSLGQDSIRKGTTAAIIGFLLVLIFMAIYYRLSGIIADIALLLNLTFLLAAIAALHATLTLPGIAGIILTIGMSVDANVLIFERIREELRTGKTIRAAIDAGYKRALLAIVDAHVTTLITAAVLFQFGTGPVKGFAVSLSLGVAISLFTAVVITRVIFDIRKGYRTLSI